MFTNPSVSDFKAYFYRDFQYGTDINTVVIDQDIAKAYTQTNAIIGQGLFSNQSEYTTGYLLLSAHYLVTNIRASSQGLAGQFAWLEASKSVGSVSQSFAIPQYVLDNPLWSQFYKTNYGAAFMGQVLPRLPAAMYNVYGTTLP